MFDIIAPMLNNYRHTILSVEQLNGYDYPVRVKGLTDVKEGELGSPDGLPSAYQDSNTRGTDRFRKKREAEVIPSDTVFMERVAQILQSRQVQGLIYSLIARSKEQADAAKTEK